MNIQSYWSHESPLQQYDVQWYWTYTAVTVATAIDVFGCAAIISKTLHDRPSLQPNAMKRKKTSNPYILVGINFAVVSVLLTLLVHHIITGRSNITWIPELSLSFVITAIIKAVLMLMVDDVLYYTYHKAAHEIPFLYKHVHHIHHEDNQPDDPFISPYYEHPVDFFVGTAFVCLSVLSIPNAWVGSAVVALFTKSTSALLQHCGKPLNVSIGDFLVFDTKFHDNHHRYGHCNYGQNFHFVDSFFRTARWK